MNKTASGGILFLSVLLITCRCAMAAEAAPESAITNIGFVLYTKSHAPGTLNARWMYSTQYRGSGIATGGPVEGFEGDYHVRYFYEDGTFSDEYELNIEQVGTIYHVDWFVDGERQATGVGMETTDGLAVGWRRLAR
ncbi:hypothetical protein [Chromatocurvus halotolerans]|uniref:Uncharacterized protein n=1 Tax=Chromatocurvus halotolerans TaxID=1132028 RepID=A0A4R2KYI1_9GAMM|nr:hypothetical protein [Chromatocurvus halotolerans]TCO78192.1 hypothetical protein EV688_1014 [Chromatocurvus halotolerans]